MLVGEHDQVKTLFIIVCVDGIPCPALLDSGYSWSILSTKLCQSWSKQDIMVNTLTESMQACCRSSTVKIRTATGNTVPINLVVMCEKNLDFNQLLGINTINELGSVHISQVWKCEVLRNTACLCSNTHVKPILV